MGAMEDTAVDRMEESMNKENTEAEYMEEKVVATLEEL